MYNWVLDDVLAVDWLRPIGTWDWTFSIVRLKYRFMFMMHNYLLYNIKYISINLY